MHIFKIINNIFYMLINIKKELLKLVKDYLLKFKYIILYCGELVECFI